MLPLTILCIGDRRSTEECKAATTPNICALFFIFEPSRVCRCYRLSPDGRTTAGSGNTPPVVKNSLRASLFRHPTGQGSRQSVAGLSELAYPRLEQRPGLRSVNLLPTCVERGESFAEPARVRFVDNHSFAAEHAQRVGIELRDVLALAERRDLGVLVDDRL